MKPHAVVKIYLAHWCPYCRRARELLAERGIVFEEIDVDGDPATRAWLLEVTGRPTIPQIFIGGEPIGGFSELKGLDEAGQLRPIVERASERERSVKAPSS